MPGWVAVIIIGVGLILFSLIYTVHLKTKRKVWIRKRYLEQKRLISYAKSSNGRISATEALQISDFELEKVKQILDRLVSKGIFTVEINKEGTVYYILQVGLDPSI